MTMKQPDHGTTSKTARRLSGYTWSETYLDVPDILALSNRGAQTAFILFSTFLDLRPVSAASYSQTSIYGWL
jgi:hypothetical protein